MRPLTVLLLAAGMTVPLLATAQAASIDDMRGACEAALLREREGHAGSSRAPCHQAFLQAAQAQDMRNEVASLMAQPAPPSLDDVVMASFIAEAAVRKSGDQPWGYLARCDIAHRFGLADVLSACLADLQRVAPAHAETLHAVRVAPARASAIVWVVRVLFLLGLLLTAGHAAFRFRARQRARRSPAPAAAAALASVALLLATGPARAEVVADEKGRPVMKNDQISSFLIDDANPEASVPDVATQNRKPLQFGFFLQDLAAKAERASQKGEQAAAARYYKAIAKASPKSSYGPRKACEALEAIGDRAGALAYCRAATAGEGTTVGDFRRLVELVLAQPGVLPSAERKELDSAIDHIEKEAQLGALPDVLRCQVALRFEDYQSLRACTARLEKAAPNDPKTVSFAWALALHAHDEDGAGELVERARAVGMSEDGVRRMEEATYQLSVGRLRRIGTWVGAALVLCGLGLLVGRWVLSRRRLAAQPS